MTARTRLHHKANPADRPQSEKFYRFLHKKKEESYRYGARSSSNRAKVVDEKNNKHHVSNKVQVLLDDKTVITDSETTILSGECDDPSVSAGSIDVMEKELYDGLCDLVHSISDEGFMDHGGVVVDNDNTYKYKDITLQCERKCNDSNRKVTSNRNSNAVKKMTIHQARLKVAKGEPVDCFDPEILIVDGAYGLGNNKDCSPDGSSDAGDTYRTRASTASTMIKATMNEKEAFFHNVQKIRNGKKYPKVTPLQINFKIAKDNAEIQAAKLAARKTQRIVDSYNSDQSCKYRRFQRDMDLLHAKGPNVVTDSPSDLTSARHRQEEIKEILLMRLAKLRGTTKYPEKKEKSVVVDETDNKVEKIIVIPNKTNQPCGVSDLSNGVSSSSTGLSSLSNGLSSLSNGISSVSNQTDGFSSLSSASCIEKHSKNTSKKKDKHSSDDEFESNCMSGNLWDTSLLNILGKHLFDDDEDENKNEENKSIARPPEVVTVSKKVRFTTTAGRKE